MEQSHEITNYREHALTVFPMATAMIKQNHQLFSSGHMNYSSLCPLLEKSSPDLSRTEKLISALLMISKS